MLRRSPHDREILRLAAPALGALAAPAFMLASAGLRFVSNRWALTGAGALP